MHMVLETKLSSWLWHCEKASSLEVCAESNLILIGTAHKLLVLQLITIDLEVEIQHHISFTHNLHHYPTMLRCQIASSATYHVWLSSHLPGDTMLCTFSKTPPKRFTTNFIPKKPYTLQESTQLARTNGKCIYPASDLKQRLHLCHSGLALITDGDSQRFHMLLQNSCGDIFHQTLSTDSHDFDNSQQIPVLLHSWMNQLNTFAPSSSTPQATDFKNMRGFRRIFTASELPVSSSTAPTPTPFKRPPRWRRSVEQLHQYKDMLAADMLAAWGFRPDVSSNKDKAAVKEKQLLGEGSRIDVTERITSWLDDTVDCDADDGDADEVVVGDVLCKEESILEDRPVEEVQVMVTATPIGKRLKDSEELLEGTPRPTPKGARKRYVQGF